MSSSRVFTVTVHAPFGNILESHLTGFLNTFALAGDALGIEVEVDVRTVHASDTPVT